MLLYFRTVQVRLQRFWYSLRVLRLTKQRLQVQIMLVHADLVAKIQSENWFDFDVVVATPDMMGVVGRLGKVLGPKGLMPITKGRHSNNGRYKGCKRN